MIPIYNILYNNNAHKITQSSNIAQKQAPIKKLILIIYIII
jgi:hypothetical protein